MMLVIRKIGLLSVLALLTSACNEQVKAGNQINTSIKEEEKQIPEEPNNNNKSYDFLFFPHLGDGFSTPFHDQINSISKNKQQQTLRWNHTVTESTTELLEQWSLLNSTEPTGIFSVAKGIVHTQTDTSFIIEHQFLENGKKKIIQVEYFPITPIEKLTSVNRNQKIGTLKGTKLFTCIRWTSDFPIYKKPLQWYAENYRHTTLPASENQLLIVVKSEYTIYHFEKGKLIAEFDICLGQEPLGHKEVEGDNKTPEGEYRITEKEKGPFYGGTGPWLGDRWMHFSYPNRFDAKLGYEKGLISKTQYLDIEKTDLMNGKTNSYTHLGGRVGLHGWNGTFIANGTQDLTWGCICMQNEDIIELFEKIPMNTKLIILP